jgi:ribonuclease HI
MLPAFVLWMDKNDPFSIHQKDQRIVKINNLSHFQVYCDGGCHNNGASTSEAYGSFKVYAIGKDDVIEKGYEEIGVAFPGIHTNNVAEYGAVEIALVYCANLIETITKYKSTFHVTIISDSKLMVNQMNGAWKAKDADIRQCRDRLQELIQNNAMDVSFEWVDRSKIVAQLGH